MCDKFMSKSNAGLAWLGGLTLLSVSPLLSAASLQLEEVVVTAQKREQSLQEVPIAVTAFSGEQLQSLGIEGSANLQVSTPGLVFTSSGATSNGVFLRGIGSRFSVAGLEPSVAVYMDDRYVSRTLPALFEFTDVERVEVLKGPQGTLYGRNATGGAIRVISKPITDELEGTIRAGVGNYDYYSLAGHINIPISDTFGARIAAMTKQRDGFADNLVDGYSEPDDMDFNAIRGKFLWDISSDISAQLTLDYWKRKDLPSVDVVILPPVDLAVGIANGGITGSKPGKTATLIDEPNDAKEFSAQLKVNFAFEPFDLVSITTYGTMEASAASDGDGTSLAVNDFYSYDENEDFAQELQLISNSGGKLDWVVGLYYFRADIDFDNYFNDFAFSLGRTFIDTEAWAVFGEATWHISDKWDLTFGGRWSEEKKELNLVNSAFPAFTAVPELKDDDEWSEFTPKVVLQRNFEQGMVYLSYSRGFKSGGFNWPASTPGQEPLEPEILDSFELGFKGDLLDGSLRLNTALYYYDYKDLQVTRSGNPAPTTANAASAEVFGLDLEVTWLASERLTLSGGLNISDSEYQDWDGALARAFVNAPAPGNVEVPFDADGHDLLNDPDWSGFVSMQYVFPAPGGAMPLTLIYSYKDSYYFDFVATEVERALEQDAYGLLNARLAYTPDNAQWEAALWGFNLTDEDYFESIAIGGTGIRASWGQPRTYGVEFSYNF